MDHRIIRKLIELWQQMIPNERKKIYYNNNFNAQSLKKIFSTSLKIAIIKTCKVLLLLFDTQISCYIFLLLPQFILFFCHNFKIAFLFLCIHLIENEENINLKKKNLFSFFSCLYLNHAYFAQNAITQACALKQKLNLSSYLD